MRNLRYFVLLRNLVYFLFKSIVLNVPFWKHCPRGATFLRFLQFEVISKQFVACWYYLSGAS